MVTHPSSRILNIFCHTKKQQGRNRRELQIKIVGISGSFVGSKTKIAMDYVMQRMNKKFSKAEIQLLNLADLNIVFSYGRGFLDYDGDTKFLTKAIMATDVLLRWS